MRHDSLEEEPDEEADVRVEAPYGREDRSEAFFSLRVAEYAYIRGMAFDLDCLGHFRHIAVDVDVAGEFGGLVASRGCGLSGL